MFKEFWKIDPSQGESRFAQLLGILLPGADDIQRGPDGQAGPLGVDRCAERLGTGGAGQQVVIEKQGFLLTEEVRHG